MSVYEVIRNCSLLKRHLAAKVCGSNKCRDEWLLNLRLPLFLLIVFAGQPALATNTLTAEEAKNHIGETATVCGVARIHYSACDHNGTVWTGLPRQRRWPLRASSGQDIKFSSRFNTTTILTYYVFQDLVQKQDGPANE